MNKRPTIDQLLERINELERRIKDLEAQPRESHVHYHQPAYQPMLVPAVPPKPVYPYIGDPIPSWQITC